MIIDHDHHFFSWPGDCSDNLLPGLLCGERRRQEVDLPGELLVKDDFDDMWKDKLAKLKRCASRGKLWLEKVWAHKSINLKKLWLNKAWWWWRHPWWWCQPPSIAEGHQRRLLDKYTFEKYAKVQKCKSGVGCGVEWEVEWSGKWSGIFTFHFSL